MVSKIFVLGDGESKSTCLRVLLAIIIVAAIIIAITVCVYSFKSDTWPVCPPPELSKYGLSNWTLDSDVITYACLPGFSLEGNESVVESHCNLEEKVWVPQPPECMQVPYLPILLNCSISQHSIEGRIAIWQEDDRSATFVSGYINTTQVNKNESVLSELIPLSYSTCSVSHALHSRLPVCDDDEGCLDIQFNSTELVSYKKMELRVTMVIIDDRNTAVIASLHQGSITIVMKIPIVIRDPTTTTTVAPSSTSSTGTSPPASTTVAGAGMPPYPY